MYLTELFLLSNLTFYFFFFFQAEDGIRDTSVTGVQTCALPISGDSGHAAQEYRACLELDPRNSGCHQAQGSLLLAVGDRKSTRLNSSHRCISYAVFCLKKKMIVQPAAVIYVALLPLA